MSFIYFYLKFCEKKQYAEDFIAGRLYMKPLEYFKGLESSVVDAGRADKYEGPSGWLQPKGLGVLQFGKIKIHPTELAGPVIVQDESLNSVNVLCLYAGTSGKFDTVSAENLHELRDHLMIPKRCLEMGRYLVMVHNVREFQSRVVNAIKRKPFKLEAGPVTYFDPAQYSDKPSKPIFMKREEFSWQREYRFAVNRFVNKAEPYKLKVGSLKDICAIVHPEKLGEMKITLPDGSTVG